MCREVWKQSLARAHRCAGDGRRAHAGGTVGCSDQGCRTAQPCWLHADAAQAFPTPSTLLRGCREVADQSARCAHRCAGNGRRGGAGGAVGGIGQGCCPAAGAAQHCWGVISCCHSTQPLHTWPVGAVSNGAAQVVQHRCRLQHWVGACCPTRLAACRRAAPACRSPVQV
jgi:hypothetical protein